MRMSEIKDGIKSAATAGLWLLEMATVGVIVLLLLHSVANARGRCDGIHSCLCGRTQAEHFNLPRNYNGYNLWQARDWALAFQHVQAQAGAVMYQHGGGRTGHVSRIVALLDNCHATVSDDKGTYERNICTRGATFVMPSMGLSARRHISMARNATGVTDTAKGTW